MSDKEPRVRDYASLLWAAAMVISVVVTVFNAQIGVRATLVVSLLWSIARVMLEASDAISMMFSVNAEREVEAAVKKLASPLPPSPRIQLHVEQQASSSDNKSYLRAPPVPSLQSMGIDVPPSIRPPRSASLSLAPATVALEREQRASARPQVKNEQLSIKPSLFPKK